MIASGSQFTFEREIHVHSLIGRVHVSGNVDCHQHLHH